mgnify:CR=1 FL=1
MAPPENAVLFRMTIKMIDDADSVEDESSDDQGDSSDEDSDDGFESDSD